MNINNDSLILNSDSALTDNNNSEYNLNGVQSSLVKSSIQKRELMIGKQLTFINQKSGFSKFSSILTENSSKSSLNTDFKNISNEQVEDFEADFFAPEIEEQKVLAIYPTESEQSFQNIEEIKEKQQKQIDEQKNLKDDFNTTNTFAQNQDDDDFEDMLFLNEYRILDYLGNGYQAKVMKCQNVQTNQIVAAKTFRVVDEEITSQIEKEFEIMSQLNHPGIIQVYDLINKDSQPTIIMEYFDGENLQNIDLFSMSNEEKCIIILQLLQITSYVHSQKIIHRDIQLKNILYNYSTQQLKLIDFGIAKKEIENNLNISQVGFRHYQAPEMFNGQIYTYKVDVWQIGQIFYEIMENCKIHSRKLSFQITNNTLCFKNCEGKIKQFILSLLEIDSNKRLDAQLAHQTLKSIIETS